MPYRPKKAIQLKNEAGITGLELENLILGFNILDGDEPFKNENHRRNTWNKHRNYIMSLQGKPCQGQAFGLSQGVYFGFFERPAAWWDYEAPEPRRLLSGDPKGALPEKGLLKGKPRFFKDYQTYQTLIYETEKQYLIRLNLLNDVEKRLFAEEK
jgi:hypothetical protein